MGNINCVRLFLIWASRSRVDVKKDFSLFLALVIIVYRTVLAILAEASMSLDVV